ncbi:MAG: sarcosine oxidase subunit delta [Rhodospirillaceae bacterium]|jgi:sarcosine oxidase, subunit delta|nr:sarcosine oxidase subunit delta [Rhodospirillaceae bacterium]MBT6117654.1 sarcosine oxidase subunit delta [Rhodospirillaceae bacterium]
MKLMPCPLNGPRNITEFACAGEVKPMPDPARASDAEWGDYVFLRENAAGVVREWWCHVPTAFWFIAERNTLTDEILKTYPASELFKQRVEFAAPGEDGA